MFMPLCQVCIALRQTLYLHCIVIVDAGVHGDRRSLVIDHTAGKDATLIRRVGGRHNGDGQFLPMHQIVADRVTPMHVGVIRAIGIVLEKQVIPSLPVNDAVGVVHPVGGGQEVMARTLEVFGVCQGHSRLTSQFTEYSAGELSPFRLLLLWTG